MPMLGKRDVNHYEFHQHWAKVWGMCLVALVVSIASDVAMGQAGASHVAVLLIVTCVIMRLRDAWNTRRAAKPEESGRRD